MFAENPSEIPNTFDRKSAESIVSAIAAGDWQITQPQFYAIPIILVLDERKAIWEAGWDEQRGKFRFRISSFQYLVVSKPEGAGRQDLYAEAKRRDDRDRKMRAEAEADPEGAFGGRGNNFFP